MMSTVARTRRAPASGTAVPARRRSRGAPLRTYLIYLAPGLLLVAVFVLYPIVNTAWYSLFDWDGLGTSTWVGLQNYIQLLTDPETLQDFGHVAVLIVFYCVLPVTVALLLSAAISRARQLKAIGTFQTLLFLPQVITPVVVGLAWTSIYAPQGVLNQILRLVGLDHLAQPWIGQVSTALPAVGLIGTWASTGLCVVLFQSGVGSIPHERLEACRIDGAGAVREFLYIVLPALRGHVAVAMTLTIISALRTFDLIYVMTGGGPGTATSVPAFQIYNLAFNQSKVGDSAAVAVTLTLIIIVLTALVGRLQGNEDET